MLDLRAKASVNIKHAEFTKYLVLFPDRWWIHWIVSDKHPASQNIASVNIKHAEFGIMETIFTLYGAVSFDNCTFKWGTSMSVYRNQYEPESREEIIKSFHSNNNTRIRITCIRIVQSRLKDELDIHIGSETSTERNTFTLARVVVENSTVQWEGIAIYPHGPTSFGLVHVSNTC